MRRLLSFLGLKRPKDRSAFNLGRELYRAKDWTGAAASFRAALSVEPSDPDYHYNLGLCLARLGELDAALEAFSRASELSDGRPRTLYQAGLILKQTGRLTEAAFALSRSLAKPTPKAALYAGAYIQLLEQTGDYDRIVATVVQVASQTAQADLAQIVALQDARRKASSAVAQFSAVDANAANRLTPHAFAKWISGPTKGMEAAADWTSALAAYDGAAWAEPDNAEWHEGRGRCLIALKRSVEASSALQAAILKSSDPKGKLFALAADSWRHQKKWWLAVETLNQATALEPKVAQWWFNLGDAYEKMDRHGDAAAAFEKAVALKRSNANWFYRLGRTRARAGMPGVEDAYHAAIALEPKAQQVGIGFFHAKDRLWPEAATAFREQAAANPENAQAWAQAGIAHDMTSSWSDATEAFLNALALDPLQGDWHRRLAGSYERAGDCKAAADGYAVAAALSSSEPSELLFRRARALADEGKFSEAALTWRSAGEGRFGLAPNHETLKSQIGDPSAKDTYLSALTTRRMAQLEAAIDANASDPENWRSLGDVAFAFLNWEKAVEGFRGAVARSDAHDPSLFYLLGSALTNLKRFDEAASAFRQIDHFRRPYFADLPQPDKTPATWRLMTYCENFQTLPIAQKTILFESDLGAGVSCNPKALFDHFLASPDYADWTFVWALTDRASLPDAYRRRRNVLAVTKGSLGYDRYLATASHLVNNSTFPSHFIRRDGQRYLNTWHGTPLKTLGKDILASSEFMSHKNTARNFLQASHIVSPNAHTTHVLTDRYDIAGTFGGMIAETGYPRIDATLKDTGAARARLIGALGLDPDKPIALYAPTWRGRMSNIDVDADRLRADLSKLSNLGYSVLFRGHHYAEAQLLASSLSANIIPRSFTSNEVLSAVDVLITDYSSIFFDYICLKRPIILYTYDFDDYIERRGRLYFELASLPVATASTIDGVVEQLKLYLDHGFSAADGAEAAASTFAPHDDGNATSRVADFFMRDAQDFVVRREADDRCKLLFYVGGFAPNGITSSALNLLRALPPDAYSTTVVIDGDAVSGDPRRLAKFRELPDHVKVVARVGRMVCTPDERWIVDRFNASNRFASDAQREAANGAHVREFTRMFGNARFDVVIDFDGYSRFWSWVLAGAADRVPQKSIYLHNDMLQERLLKFPALSGLFKLLSLYQTLVSVSPAMKDVNRDALAADFGLPPERFTSTPNVIDGSSIRALALEPLDAELDALTAGAAKLFVTLGRMSPEKNHQKLVRAFAKLDPVANDLKLIILGDGPLRAEILALVHRLKLDSAVSLPGLRENPFPLMALCDCFVLSSDHEGQPMTLLEALTLKKPIVATDIKGSRAVLEGTGAALVENSVDGLADGMRAVVAGHARATVFDDVAYRRHALEQFERVVLRLRPDPAETRRATQASEA